MNTDIWVGALTTLAGAALGGAISFALSHQQLKEVRRQREEDVAQERLRRSADRRFQAYSDFVTRARSFRNAVGSYCMRPDQKPTIAELDTLLRAANDASALVFLVVESDDTYRACGAILNSLGRAQDAVSSAGSNSDNDLWYELEGDMGRTLRNFQIAARAELEVRGKVIPPWLVSGKTAQSSVAANSPIADTTDPTDQIL